MSWEDTDCSHLKKSKRRKRETNSLIEYFFSDIPRTVVSVDVDCYSIKLGQKICMSHVMTNFLDGNRTYASFRMGGFQSDFCVIFKYKFEGHVLSNGAQTTFH